MHLFYYLIIIKIEIHHKNNDNTSVNKIFQHLKYKNLILTYIFLAFDFNMQIIIIYIIFYAFTYIYTNDEFYIYNVFQ